MYSNNFGMFEFYNSAFIANSGSGAFTLGEPLGVGDLDGVQYKIPFIINNGTPINWYLDMPIQHRTAIPNNILTQMALAEGTNTINVNTVTKPMPLEITYRRN